MSNRQLEEREEKKYLDDLFNHVSKDNVRNAYVEPVLNRLVKELKRNGEVPYDRAFNALKRAANEVARNWKLETTMVLPVSKAGHERQIENLTRTFMEVWLVRRRLATDRPKELDAAFQAAIKATKKTDLFDCPKCGSSINTRHGDGTRTCGKCFHEWKIKGH